MNSKKARNSAIELLRIIAIIGVVILHYNNPSGGGAFKYVTQNSLNYYYLHSTESLFICAVNLFIMISGYFLAGTQKRKISKVAELIIQVAIFQELFYLADIALGAEILSPFKMLLNLLPTNYFVILYSVLYIVSPHINRSFQNISQKQFKHLTVILFLTFSVLAIFADLMKTMYGIADGLNPVGLWGDQMGYTIVNFTLSYCLGAYLRISKIKMSKKKAIIGIFLCLLWICAEEFIENRLWRETLAWNYNHPAVMLMPVFLILLFMNFNFESKCINECAKASFTCFLFHGYFLHEIMVEKFVNQNIFILIAHQVGSAILLFALAYLIYKVYSAVTNPLFKRISPKIDKLDKYLY